MGGTVRHSMRSLGNLQIEIEAARSAIEFETLQIASASTPAPRRVCRVQQSRSFCEISVHPSGTRCATRCRTAEAVRGSAR